jgi:formylglycine-generating enzyme required for sulfatase activity
LKGYWRHVRNAGDVIIMKNMAKTFLWIAAALLLLCSFSSTARSATKTYTNSIGMEFVRIPAGSFPIATGRNDFGEIVSGTKAVITKPFYLGKYEVTQEQWVAVMGSGHNPSVFKGRTNPVESVSWNDVQEFIRRLNDREGHTKYRLPTEMEWEHAARGGTGTLYFFMKDPKTFEEAEAPLADYAWFGKNSGATHPVGQKKPNPYGLYDIYGNVWEWVQDWGGDLPKSPEIIDYRGPSSGSVRVNRGGSWYSDAERCRSGYRSHDTPDDWGFDTGFRLALSAD